MTDLSCDDYKNDVMAIDDDDTERNVTSLAAATPVLICGQRKLSGGESCPCDCNPVSVTK